MVLFLSGCGEGRPPEISLPGIVVAIQPYDKQRVLQSEDLNLVQLLSQGNFDGDTELEILVTGTDASCLLDEDLKRETCSSYMIDGLYGFRLVDLEGDGVFEYLTSGLWGTPAAAVVDLGGEVRWRYDKKYASPGLHAIDLDDDGVQEVVLDSRKWLQMTGNYIVYDPG